MTACHTADMPINMDHCHVSPALLLKSCFPSVLSPSCFLQLSDISSRNGDSASLVMAAFSAIMMVGASDGSPRHPRKTKVQEEER